MAFRVGFDISALNSDFKAHAVRGTGRYVRELHRELAACSSDLLSAEFFDQSSLVKSLKRVTAILPYGKMTVQTQLLFPLKLRFGGLPYQAVHFPAHTDAPSWCPLPLVVTVLDLIPLVLSDLYAADKPNWRFKFARSLEARAIRNARLVLAISEHTAADVVKYLGIQEERITVTPLGINQSFGRHVGEDERQALLSRHQLSSERKIILYIGGIDQRKNWPVLLEVTKRLVSAHRELNKVPPQLVMAGRITADEQYPLLTAKLRELGIEDDVVLLDMLDDRSIEALLSLAGVFFFPSLYEGFGLTPLEAMAAGVPVVSSNASCLPEVLGDAAIYVRPDDAVGACEAILSVLDNRQLTQELVRRGKGRAAHYTWSNTASKTMAAYERLIK